MFNWLICDPTLQHNADESHYCEDDQRCVRPNCDRHDDTPELSWEPFPQWSKVSLNSALREIAAMLARRRAPCGTGVAGMCLILYTT
jgi:hypothetical protein